MKRRYWSDFGNGLQYAQLPPHGMKPDQNGMINQHPNWVRY